MISITGDRLKDQNVSGACQKIPTQSSLQIQVTRGVHQVHEKLHSVHEKYELIAFNSNCF